MTPGPVSTGWKGHEAFDIPVRTHLVGIPTASPDKAGTRRAPPAARFVHRSIKSIPLDLSITKIFVFVDSSFANNSDMLSQLVYIIIIGKDNRATDNAFRINGNIIHYSSTKSKRVTRSVLASEIPGSTVWSLVFTWRTHSAPRSS